MTDYQLAMHDVGHGECIAIFTGQGGMAAHLLPLAEALSATHRVLVAYFPGDGASAVYPGEYSMKVELELTETALRFRGVDSAHLIGFSGGAYRCFALAVSGRIRARSIAALGGYASLPPDMRESMRVFASLVRAHQISDDMLIGRMLSPGFAAANPGVAAEIGSWVRGQVAEGVAQQLDAIADCEDLTARLRQLRAPICARVGEHDAAVPIELSRQIIQAAPHATLEIVAGVAHALLAEDFDETLRSIRRVIASA